MTGNGWRTFTISGAGEETQCESCGYPLYSGDRAYEAPSLTIHCSQKCEEGSA